MFTVQLHYKTADKLYTLCLQLHIHYFHYLLTPPPGHSYGCGESMKSDTPIDMNINDQGKNHQRSQKKNDTGFPWSSN